MMKLKKKRILAIIILLFFAPLFSFYSYWIVEPTIYGDAASYKALYDALSSAGISEVKRLGVLFVSSRELSPYLLWFGAKLGVEKDIYITFFNVVLLSGMTCFILNRKINLGVLLLLLLMLTNFYVVVLMTSAERLKFAYVFLILASLSKGNLRGGLFFSSIFMHFQSIVFVVAQLIYLYSDNFKDTFLAKKARVKSISRLKIFTTLLFGMILIFYFKDGILIKATGYLSNSRGSLSEVFQLILLFLASAPLIKKRFATISMFLFYAIAILLIGGSRVNMIAFTSVFYILLSENRLNKFTIQAVPFYLLLIYLSLKSIGYIERTFIQGHGWVI